PAVTTSENIIIHILEDGFTVLGKVFYRGDELEFIPGSQAYNDTKDRNGVSWLDVGLEDEYAQVDKWGKIMFRRGPWPGKGYAAGAGRYAKMRGVSGDGHVTGPSEEQLTALDEAARKARRLAPTIGS